MNRDELKAVFNQQASGYEKQHAALMPIRESLYFLLASVFAELPVNARILCVGLGTGAEAVHLARRFPGWRFTAVEPSGGMLDVFRQRAEKEGFLSRCTLHEGFLDSLPEMEMYDAATCFMVSQFILDSAARSAFFQSIAQRLKPSGILASSDLSSKVGSPEYHALVRAWMNMLYAAQVPPEALERTQVAWAKDVAILAPADVGSIIQSGGFEAPVQFYQAGLIHAWFARSASINSS